MDLTLYNACGVGGPGKRYITLVTSIKLWIIEAILKYCGIVYFNW